MSNQWKSPETAPKHGTILAHFGFSWPFVAMYSEAQGEWIAAEVEPSIYQGKSDPGWVTEYFKESELLGWMDMPELPEVRKV